MAQDALHPANIIGECWTPEAGIPTHASPYLDDTASPGINIDCCAATAD
jgi:hypothetical protein